eukprot:3325733-Prymnesium_polylepis.5
MQRAPAPVGFDQSLMLSLPPPSAPMPRHALPSPPRPTHPTERWWQRYRVYDGATPEHRGTSLLPNNLPAQHHREALPPMRKGQRRGQACGHLGLAASRRRSNPPRATRRCDAASVRPAGALALARPYRTSQGRLPRRSLAPLPTRSPCRVRANHCATLGRGDGHRAVRATGP